MGIVAGVAIDVAASAAAASAEAAAAGAAEAAAAGATEAAAAGAADAAGAAAEAGAEAAGEAGAEAGAEAGGEAGAEGGGEAAGTGTSTAVKIARVVQTLSKLIKEYFAIDAGFKAAKAVLVAIEGDNSPKVKRLQNMIDVLVGIENKMTAMKDWIDAHQDATVKLDDIYVPVDSGVLAKFMTPLADVSRTE